MSREKGFGGSLGYTVREREFEVFGEELLDVWALDVVGLLELNYFENLSPTLVGRIGLCGERATYVD